MKLKRKDNKTVPIVFLLLILVIGIGYAYLSSNLSITGATSVAGNTWDIHFENVQVTTGSVTASTPAAIDTNDNTLINYAILLEKPGDFYEFTVDIVNSGTLPGEISLATISGIDSTYEDIIEYSINYTNDNPVQVGDILNDGSTKTIRVRTYFNEDIDVDELPEDDFNLNLVLNMTYIQAEERELTTTRLVQQLKTENSSCFTKYEGQVTDQVGQTVTAQNVYFNQCTDKRNIIFNNMCFQMIRTTETGGIKMIYNGEPDGSGECSSSRGDHKGIVGADGSTQTLNAEYLYGDSFTYDITNSTFTLTDTTTATWSDSTYENLLGKFTCKNTEGTCTTLYNVNGYSNNTTAYTSSYTIGDTNYAQIGTSSFNANKNSPAMVGYMFNKVYNYKNKSISSSTKFGSTFTYINSTYTLSGTTQDLTTLNGSNIANTHYTCWNAEGTCSNISYVYYKEGSTGYYIEISDGKSIIDAINEMLYNNNVNRYNSSIKGIIDVWYRQNLNSKTNMLEDTVFCNARNVINQANNGWNPEGGSVFTQMYFKNYNSNNDMSCVNEVDQFAVSNNKAKLKYSIALATSEELYNLTMNNSSSYYSVLTKTNATWWNFSPYYFDGSLSHAKRVTPQGSVNSINYVYFRGGVRPVISLVSSAVITGGTGSEIDPWIVE